MADRKSQIPTRKEIAKLPRWARVAFAAHCARRVQARFIAAWPDAPAKHIEALDRAIMLSEHAAACATDADANGASAISAAYTACAEAEDFAHFAYSPIAYKASPIAYKASDARLAAEAAKAAFDAATHLDISAAYSAARAAATTTGASCMIRRDYELLRITAKQDQWTDDTPVPPEFFGPLWPDGAPDGWPVQEQGSADHRLLIELEVPDGVSDEEVISRAKELSNLADDLHRAYGGAGLKVEEIQIYDDAAVREGVPS